MTSDSQAAGPIVFLHIFKSAGTSVHKLMKKRFGREAVARVIDGPEFETRVKEAVAAAPRALIGHFRMCRIAPALAAAGVEAPRYFALMRDPADRLVSAYNYFRKHEAARWHEAAASMDINGFLSHLAEAAPHIVVNHQCGVLSEDGAATFEAARETVERRFALLGCMEEMAAITPQAEARLGLGFDATVRDNAAPRRQDAADFTPETRALIAEITREDQKLHDWARARIREAT